jgi:hypothetical protein
MHVRPKIPGSIVRFEPPSRRVLDQAGEAVPDTLYWRRRVAHEDVVELPASVGFGAHVPAEG